MAIRHTEETHGCERYSQRSERAAGLGLALPCEVLPQTQHVRARGAIGRHDDVHVETTPPDRIDQSRSAEHLVVRVWGEHEYARAELRERMR